MGVAPARLNAWRQTRVTALLISVAGITVGLSGHDVHAAGPFTYTGSTGSPIGPSSGTFTTGFSGAAPTNSNSSTEFDFLDLDSSGFIATNDAGGVGGVSVGTLKLGNNTNFTDSIAGGTLSFASGGTLTQNGNGTFTISAPFAVGAATIFNGIGTGALNISGALINAGSLYGLNFNGFNTTTFSGANVLGAGSTTINSGTLALDYSTQANSKLGTGALSLGDGALNVIGNSTTAVTQAFSSLSLTGGNANINIASGKTNLSLGAVTSASGGVVNFTNSGSSTTIATTSSNVGASILAPYAIFAGSSFATVSSGNIIALPDASYQPYTSQPVGGTTTDETQSANYATGSSNKLGNIRFNSAAAVTLNINSGATTELDAIPGIGTGILETANVGNNADVITGDNLSSNGGPNLFVGQYNTANTLTINNKLTLAGYLDKFGPGTLVLSNTSNTYSTTYLYGGFISVGAIGQLSTTALIFNGGGIKTTVGITLANTATLNAGGGTVDVISGATTTLSGAISGVGGLTKADSGTAIVSHLNSYTGPTNIAGGVLQSGVAQSGTTGPFGTYSAIVLANTANTSLNLNNFNATLGSITGGGSTGGNIVLGSASMTVGADNTSPAPYAGMISSTTSGKLTKTGTGYLTLTGVNAYNGGTTISAGVLLANSSSQSLGTGATTISGGVLAGTGATGGPVTVYGSSGSNGTGTITAGSGATANDSIGTLNTGTETWTLGGVYASKVGNSGVSDDLIMTGLVPPTTGAFTVQVTGTPNTIFSPNETWIVAEVIGGSSATFNSTVLNSLTVTATGSAQPVASKFKLTEVGINDANGIGEGLQLQYNGTTTTPEPASAMILATLAYPLLLHRRRRIARQN